MKVQYLNTSNLGVRWFKNYYRRNSQLDRAKAVNSLRNAERSLQENPYIGGRFEDSQSVREKEVLGTTYSLLYTIARNTIWIIDLRDQRGNRSVSALRQYTQELRTRFGIHKG
jgi:plasmid stabilization system protein ParE